MGLHLNIIDIATSMMRSVNKAVSTMSAINLKELPLVNLEPLPEFWVKGPRGTFVSIMLFDQKEKKWARGAIAVFISAEQIQTLFSKAYGVDAGSPASEIIDVCGEFCNVVAGGFKKELAGLNYGEVEINVPENYYQEVNKKLNLVIHCKYQLIFSYKGVDLLTVDVAMESPD